MAREILFRGKVKETDKWIDGDLIHRHGEHCITNGDVKYLVIVQPETVGQFIGQYDNEGKQIFEGDVVEFPCGDKLEVRFNNNESAYELFGHYNALAPHLWSECQVVGNIHNNPELLN